MMSKFLISSVAIGSTRTQSARPAVSRLIEKNQAF
jgi:hypothetical protein